MVRSNNVPIVDVCGKRMLDYIVETLGKFNWGAEEVIIRSVGRNISRGVEVAQIFATSGFNIEVSSININQIEVEYQGQYSCIDISLVCKSQAGDYDRKSTRTDYLAGDFVEYPIYHILIDSMLGSRKKLEILTHDDMNLITVTKSDWEYECQVNKGLAERIDDSRKSVLSKLTEAFYRSGMLISPVWESVAKELSKTDDVIIGVDTCMLYDAALTEQLLNSLSIIGSRKHFHTPNWLLIVIPSAVMQELERTANIRDNRGFLMFKGRMGFRALQEILELNRARDLSGISLIIVGETNPELDTRVELQALRNDFSYNLKNIFRRLHQKEADTGTTDKDERAYEVFTSKLSSGDMIIRDQFKQFLRQIDFHKGMYFLTSDKTNSALAQTEGLNSIYYTKPPFYLLKDSAEKPIKPRRIRFTVANSKQTGDITLGVPLGKLIYELTVGFGTIKVRTEKEEVRIRCDAKGESLDHWLYKDLIIRYDDVQKLKKQYEPLGKFSLDKIMNVWNNINKPAE